MNTKVLEKLAHVVRVDVAQLSEVLTDESKDFDFNLKVFNETEFETLQKQIQKSGYENGKTAAIEMSLKDLKAKFKNAGIETEGIKDLETLINTVTETERKKILTNDFAAIEKEKQLLKIEIEKQKSEYESKISLFEQKIKNHNVSQVIANAFDSIVFEVPKHIEDKGEKVVSEYLKTQKENAILVFKSIHDIDFDGENVLIKKGNDIIKNNLQEPEKIDNILPDFLLSRGLIQKFEKPNGRGSQNYNHKAGYKGINREQFDAKMQSLGIKTNTSEYDTEYIKFKKDNQ